MLETNPTMGSIETTDWKKRCHARESWSINLENKDFCRLFPEIAEVRNEFYFEVSPNFSLQECKERLRVQRQQSWRVTDRVSELSDSFSAGLRGQNAFSSALVNIGVILGFVAFLYTARYVIAALHAADHGPSS